MAICNQKAISCHNGNCGRIVRLFKWLPVLFISSVVVWSYYAYVYHLVIRSAGAESVPEAAVLAIVYHAFLAVFLWAYYRTIFTPAGAVPRHFRLSADDLEAVESASSQRAALEQLAMEKDLPISMRSINGEIRFCSECSIVKPDRAHHCSVCGRCVLKMDHHCPWVNNCVAFYNYKFFVLFLAYALSYCIYVALSTLKYFVLFWSTSNLLDTQSSKFHILFLFFVSAMFSVSLISLFGYHCYLISRNQTTLEAFRAPIFRHGPDKSCFHLGVRANLQEVFGDGRGLKCALPVFTSLGDGIVFPQRTQLDEEAGLLDPSSSALARAPSSAYPTEEHVPMLLATTSASSTSESMDAPPPHKWFCVDVNCRGESRIVAKCEDQYNQACREDEGGSCNAESNKANEKEKHETIDQFRAFAHLCYS